MTNPKQQQDRRQYFREVADNAGSMASHVLRAMFDCVNGSATCGPSHAQLARDMGICEKSVDRAVQALLAGHYLRIRERRAGRRAQVYEILYPDKESGLQPVDNRPYSDMLSGQGVGIKVNRTRCTDKESASRKRLYMESKDSSKRKRKIP